MTTIVVRDRNADLREVFAKDICAMTGGIHPRRHHGAGITLIPGDVLAVRPPRVAHRREPIGWLWVRRTWKDMRHLPALRHLIGLDLRGAHQLYVRTQCG